MEIYNFNKSLAEKNLYMVNHSYYLWPQNPDIIFSSVSNTGFLLFNHYSNLKKYNETQSFLDTKVVLQFLNIWRKEVFLLRLSCFINFDSFWTCSVTRLFDFVNSTLKDFENILVEYALFIQNSIQPRRFATEVSDCFSWV